MVEVIEHFPERRTPVRSTRAIRKIIASTLPEHLKGLGKVVLTDAAALPSRRKRRARSEGRRGSRYLGIYHRARKGQPARIELYLDNILDGYRHWELRLPPFRDYVLGEVFFHELGHHLHRTQRPEFKDPEAVADAWSRELLRAYMRRRHGYLRIFVPLLRLLNWVRKRGRGVGKNG